jgi:hypothetical protein
MHVDNPVTATGDEGVNGLRACGSHRAVVNRAVGPRRAISVRGFGTGVRTNGVGHGGDVSELWVDRATPGGHVGVVAVTSGLAVAAQCIEVVRLRVLRAW